MCSHKEPSLAINRRLLITALTSNQAFALQEDANEHATLCEMPLDELMEVPLVVSGVRLPQKAGGYPASCTENG